MVKNILKTGIILTTAILPVSALISCSSSSTASNNLNAKKYQTKQLASTKSGMELNVLDPAFNNNAQEILQGLLQKLTTADLQKDFDFLLTDFYDVYEFENNETEIELVDRGIKVISILPDKNANGNRVAKLEVKYKKETEVKGDIEEILTKEMDWEIKPAIISHSQIDEIKAMILGATTNNEGIDLSDLKEYFLGEKDDDMDFDDFGVFDRINKLNKDLNLDNLGGLVGYQLSLNDIFGNLIPAPKAGAVDLNTTFFAPSTALNNVFLYPSSVGKIQYKFNIEALKLVDKKTVLAYTQPEQLISMLVTSETNNAMMLFIKDIKIEEVGGSLLKLTVNFKDANTLSEVVSINANLLKPTVVVPPVA
ncbi:MAG: hypothetical protein KFW07_02135 [Mycoplasmataceae bacterium]|nr:hypothetical protein [Mycoplasmataceae bacterium]